MTVALTDEKRAELEQDNILNVLLAGARRGENLDEERIARALGMDLPTTKKILEHLKIKYVIK